MAKYDLTGSLETSFTFSIDGKEFKFRKPTVREMRSIAKRFAGIEKEQDLEKQSEMSDAAMRELYTYIEPINHDAVLEELLDNQTVDVQKAFNEMVKTELGAQ